VSACRAEKLEVLVELLATTASIAHGHKQQVLRLGNLCHYRHQRHHDGNGVLQDAPGTTILQGGPKKTAPNFSCNNFGKYGPILIMFSLLHSQIN